MCKFYHHIYTIVFVRSIILRFTEDEFHENMQSTVGMDYKTKQVTIDDNTVKLAIWVSCINELLSYVLYFHYVIIY